MKSLDALQEFNRMLKARGTNASWVSVGDGIDTMIEFYRSTRADDCAIEDDGDMLLFQWGSYDWGKGRHFELDITRQFTGPGAEDDDIWQLSLTFVFPPNAIASGNRWCRSPGDLDEFASFVRSHAATAAAAQSRPIRVELDYECVG